VIIVADRDDAGRRGAERLRDALLIVAVVRIVSPPQGIKDARAWVCSGVDRAVVERVADVAKECRLTMGGVKHG
jgi:DNA primase